jgi:DNA-binding LytR/AlgR family response regulator
MKTRCLVIDDEPLAARLINSYIQQVPGLETVAVCNSSIEAYSVLQQHKIDLIFLDIKMPRLTGTDFLKSLAHPPKVIFVTAYREYALEGFELDVVDYLLKPVSFGRFMKAVTKAMKLLSLENSPEKSNEIFSENKNAFVYLKANKEMTKVLLNEILYIESRKEYIKIYFSNDTPLLVKQTISSMEKLLSPHKFIRIHRSFIVTIDKITSFTSTSVSIGDMQLPVGRLYKNEVEKALVNG